MCGIGGIFNFYEDQKGPTITKDFLNRLGQHIAHRGPDGHGSWVSSSGHVGLLHRRLAVLELTDSASQPMRSGDNTVVLCFNGEIYNHNEIRDQLVKTQKYEWRTDHSDTEVVLNAYLEWGEDFVLRLRGMFAIAIWDSNRSVLHLYRDRLGIKPLYYYKNEKTFIFSSEIKMILEVDGVPRSIDNNSLSDYLSFLYVPAPRTMFADIFKLAAGTRLSISTQGVTEQQRYWDLVSDEHQIATSQLIDQNIHESQLFRELYDSVAIHSEADVPVGVFLSGGVDSSVNASLFSKVTDHVHTFSIGYDEDYASAENELGYAREVSDLVESQHTEKTLDVDDLLAFLPKMIWHLDEPNGDPVCVPNYYLAKSARDAGMVVSQAGEGADEVFFGYASYQTYFLMEKILGLVPMSLKRSLNFIMSKAPSRLTWMREFIYRASSGLPVFWGGALGFSLIDKENIFSDRLKEATSDYSVWSPLAQTRIRFLNQFKKSDHLKWISYLDLNHRIPDLLMMRLDKMTMACSLEGRVPFLDHRVVEYGFSLPDDLKLKNKIGKYLLKKVAEKLIPRRIIYRRKIGFSTPVTDWIDGKLGQIMFSEISYFIKYTDYFDEREVLNLFKKPRRNSLKLWMLFNLALWWRMFIEKNKTVKNLELKEANL